MQVNIFFRIDDCAASSVYRHQCNRRFSLFRDGNDNLILLTHGGPNGCLKTNGHSEKSRQETLDSIIDFCHRNGIRTNTKIYLICCYPGSAGIIERDGISLVPYLNHCDKTRVEVSNFYNGVKTLHVTVEDIPEYKMYETVKYFRENAPTGWKLEFYRHDTWCVITPKE